MIKKLANSSFFAYFLTKISRRLSDVQKMGSFTPSTRVAIIVLALIASGSGAARAQSEGGEFDKVRHILTNRCLFCHTAIPQEDGLNQSFQAPKGVVFDTPEQIARLAPRILTFAVQAKTMPPNNATGMTDEERQAVGAWIEAGAQLPKN